MNLFTLIGIMTTLSQPHMQLTRQWVLQTPTIPPANYWSKPIMTLTSKYLELGYETNPSMANGIVEVIDRKTGKLTWRRKGDGSTDLASPVKGNLVACSQDNIAIFDNGTRMEGVDLADGSVLWTIHKSKWRSGDGFVGMYSSVFAVASWKSRTALLYDVKSGKRLDPRNKADALILGRSAEKCGTYVVPNQNIGGHMLLNLLTGDITQITGANGYEIAVIGDRILCYIDLDDGYAGHSQWAKYLASYDFHGKKRWQFPKHLDWGPYHNQALGTSYQDVPVWVPDAKRLLAITKYGLYGISARDGRPIWHSWEFTFWDSRYVPIGKCVIIATDRGGLRYNYLPGTWKFVIQGPEALYCLNMSNGYAYRILDGSPILWDMVADPEQVITLDSKGVVRAYRIQWGKH